MCLIKKSVHVCSDETNKHAKMHDKSFKYFSFAKGIVPEMWLIFSQ